MKLVISFIAVLLLLAVPLADAQEESVLQLNMTLGEENMADDYAYAIGHVYVNVTEPPVQPGITGLFSLEAFSLDEFLDEMEGFLSSLAALLTA